MNPTIMLGDLHAQHRNGNWTVQKVAKELAVRIKHQAPTLYEKLREDGSIDTLEDVGSVVEYNEILENMYDWAEMLEVWVTPVFLEEP